MPRHALGWYRNGLSRNSPDPVDPESRRYAVVSAFSNQRVGLNSEHYQGFVLMLH
jgi:hypothetical protein